MDFVREDEEIDSFIEWPSTTIAPETTAVTNPFVMFDNDLKALNQTILDNSTAASATITTTTATIVATYNTTQNILTDWFDDAFKNAQEYHAWSKMKHLIENIVVIFKNVTNDFDLMALCLIVLAIVIAIGGLAAIFVQCYLLRKTKRQLQKKSFDTTSWFEYAFDREKFSHLDHNGNDITKTNLENNKEEKLQNLLNDMSKNNKEKTNLIRLNDSLKSRSEFSTIDIEKCQLVQSFMKYDSDLNSGKNNKQMIIKKNKKSSLSRVEKRKISMKEKNYQHQNECKTLNNNNNNNNNNNSNSNNNRKTKFLPSPTNSNRCFIPYTSNMVLYQSMPMLHLSSSILIPSKKKRPTIDDHNDLLLQKCPTLISSMIQPRVRKHESNYETQTCALNLSYDSADTDLSNDPTIEADRATERPALITVSKSPMFDLKTAAAVADDNVDGVAAAAAAVNTQYGTASTSIMKKVSIERSVKSRQQIPKNCTQTRSFDTNFSKSLTANTDTSSISSSTSLNTNQHFLFSSAISKNPLYRELSCDSHKKAKTVNKTDAEFSSLGVIMPSCSTFTKPRK